MEEKYKILQKVNHHYQLVCARDYKGELCPYSNFVLDNKENKIVNETLFWNYVTSSCTSKTCGDAFINALEVDDEITDKDQIKLFKKAKDYLQTENCTSQIMPEVQHYKSNPQSSNTTLRICRNKLKIINLLVIVLFIFITVLF